jgi:hypothetical protein
MADISARRVRMADSEPPMDSESPSDSRCVESISNPFPALIQKALVTLDLDLLARD